MHVSRLATPFDKPKILALYRKVAKISGGIARSEVEINDEYIQYFMDQASLSGIQLVIDHPQNSNSIIAEIHGYKLAPKVFSHVISELTIAVDPEFHGIGVGKTIFRDFLTYIEQFRTDILRVELVTQETNQKALKLYQGLGFEPEGRFHKRMRMYDNRLDADIPMAWFNKNFTE